MTTTRPITVLIAALGGEGGGVLADWIVAACRLQGFAAQATSIPGVAQRTGATTYYLEIHPVRDDTRRPVMALAPVPGDVDVMLATELLEAGRAFANGYVTGDRTTLIASTHRIYTVAEKMQMGDGRFDHERLLEAARTLPKRAVLMDMQALAVQAGSVINAVLFGALAGSGALPLPRETCEEAIRSAGKGAEASLQAFALGHERACGGVESSVQGEPVQARPATRPPAEERVSTFPQEAREIIRAGVARLVDYQGAGYADLYLDRLTRVAEAARGGPSGTLIAETARYLALWMSFDDVVRVADLKTRRSRFQRVRDEVRAKPTEPVHIVDYFKPRREEVAALLPAWAASWLLRPGRRRDASEAGIGLHVRTTSVSGFLLLRILASLRPLRPFMARYREEQRLIERWLGAVQAAAREDVGLAVEIARCGRLIKGYSDTHERGRSNFLRILETLVEPTGMAAGEKVVAIREAVRAALADPEGRTLDSTLAARGFEPRTPQAKPLHFFPRPSETTTKAA